MLIICSIALNMHIMESFRAFVFVQKCVIFTEILKFPNINERDEMYEHFSPGLTLISLATSLRYRLRNECAHLVKVNESEMK